MVEGWERCEKIVSGKSGARYRGFPNREAAETWLKSGAEYQRRAPAKLEKGIYFDSGTGRGKGVEVSVTDETGKDLLKSVSPRLKLNRYGKLPLGTRPTNNYGELLAAKYALELAFKKKARRIFGDSRLVIDYWSRSLVKKKKVPGKTVQLAKEVARLRKRFESGGGEVLRIDGADNPADIGFH